MSKGAFPDDFSVETLGHGSKRNGLGQRIRNDMNGRFTIYRNRGLHHPSDINNGPINPNWGLSISEDLLIMIGMMMRLECASLLGPRACSIRPNPWSMGLSSSTATDDGDVTHVNGILTCKISVCLASFFLQQSAIPEMTRSETCETQEPVKNPMYL